MSSRIFVVVATIALIVSSIAIPVAVVANEPNEPNEGPPHAGQPHAEPAAEPESGTAATAEASNILIYGPTANGYADTTPGTTVTIWSAATWATKTTADFAAFDAIVFGDRPICFGSPSIWDAAVQNRQVWSAAITGNIIINGTDPDFHGKSLLVHQSVQFAAADPGPGPGLYVSLSCAYHDEPTAVTVGLLQSLGHFTAKGVINCPSDAHKVADHPTLAGIDDAYLSNWSCSAHEVFQAWPGGFQPLAIIQDATPTPPNVTYTAADGQTGYVYLLARGASVDCLTAVDPDGDCLPNDVEATLGTDPQNPDTDGDGLLDSWEVRGVAGAGVRLPNGITIDRDEVFGPFAPEFDISRCLGVVDETDRITGQYSCLNNEPDPLHKDVYIEIDWQDCTVEHACPEVISEDDDPLHHAPNLAALVDLFIEFRQAPVTNPNDLPGVRLHILIDEAVPHAPNCDQNASARRAISFGTPFQRQNLSTIEAKRLAVRYVWSGHSSHNDDDVDCPNPDRIDFALQGFGINPLADYDYSPFGDANVGGRDILLTLGPLWSCSSNILTPGKNLGFDGPCFRETHLQTGGFLGGPPPPAIWPGIFPAKIEVPGEGEVARKHPVHRLLGQRERDAIRQLWGRSLMHLLGHSLGIADDATVGNWPSPAGRKQADHDHPLTPLLPESYASWNNLSYVPGDGVPTAEGFPNYRELAQTNAALSDPDDDGVLEHDDNCPGVWNEDQDNTDFGFLGFGVNVLEYGDACDPDIDGDGERNPLPGQNDLAEGLTAAEEFDPFPFDTDNDGSNNAADADDDNDGVPDSGDRCPLAADAGQADLDGDGAGDRCDLDSDGDGFVTQFEALAGSDPRSAAARPEYAGFGTTCTDGTDNDADGSADAADADCVDGDGDGASNPDDNCPTVDNPSQVDQDDDGIGDACQTLVRIDGVREAFLGPGHAGTQVAWSASAAGSYSVRIGGGDCSTGLVIDSGTYDPGPLNGEPTGRSAFAIIEPTELAEGENTVRVCLVSGGTTRHAESTVTVDTTAPAAPTITLAAASDTGMSDSDRITSKSTPVLAGTAEPGAGVVVRLDGAVVGSAPADAAGNWELTLSETAAEGVRSFTATALDVIGNTSPTGPALSVTFDFTAPVSGVSSVSAGGAVSFSASDAVGIDRVEIWFRHRPNVSTPFGSWQLGPAGSTSPIQFGFPNGAGTYEIYSIGGDRAGNREAAPATADVAVNHAVGDTTKPVSSAGALPATTTANSVNVSYTATDDASGVAGVELWVRYRRSLASAFGSWTKVATATSSPISYTFAFGDGRYEFYTIAVDGAGNREAAPTTADAFTTREAVDDPPDMSFSGFLDIVLSCTPRGGCTPLILLSGNGAAADDRSNVTKVEFRILGVNNGISTAITNWKAATARDGKFNSPYEEFSVNASPPSGYAEYRVEIRVSAGSQSSTRVFKLA